MIQQIGWVVLVIAALLLAGVAIGTVARLWWEGIEHVPTEEEEKQWPEYE